MGVILNIETTTTLCSVSLANKGNLVSFHEVNDLVQYRHSHDLHPFIEKVMLSSGVDYSQLDAVAVSEGPGSYTGLRIGVAAAKGICFSLNLPLIAIPTLELLARQVEVKKGKVIPMLDARRDEVYAAVYDQYYNLIEDAAPIVINKKSFTHYLEQGKVLLLGTGAKKCMDLIPSHSNLTILSSSYFPSSQHMSRLSQQKFVNSDFVDVAYFEPRYLKPFQFSLPKKKIL